VTAPPPTVEVCHVSRWFPRGRASPILALEDVSFDVQPGSFVSLVGPSGCGKSTLLRMLAGLERPSGGEIRVWADDSPPVPPGQLLGTAGFMPQRDLLMPWRSVLDNATVALEFQGVARREAHERARALLPIFGLEGFGGARPSALSGGMRQRVALLRTVLSGRSLLLLDEPFGALDAITRAELHEWLAGLLAGMAATVILVTHDLEEAAYLSDLVYVMTDRPGRIAAAVPVDLDRPRPYAVTTSAEFAAIKRELLAALRAAHRPGISAHLLGGGA
jgi:ABC-type nitrate/sulfonate/bicarbonate transport system ATPase subunit